MKTLKVWLTSENDGVVEYEYNDVEKILSIENKYGILVVKCLNIYGYTYLVYAEKIEII